MREKEIEDAQDTVDHWGSRPGGTAERAERSWGLGDDAHMGLCSLHSFFFFDFYDVADVMTWPGAGGSYNLQSATPSGWQGLQNGRLFLLLSYLVVTVKIIVELAATLGITCYVSVRSTPSFHQRDAASFLFLSKGKLARFA